MKRPEIRFLFPTSADLIMYTDQVFSSGSYGEMFTGNPLLPHNYSESVGGGQNEAKFITAMGDTVTMQSIGDSPCNSHAVPRTQMGMVDGDQNMQCQGLSLSLGTMLPSNASVPPFQYQYPDTGLMSLMTSCLPNLKGNSNTLSKDDEANLHKELRSAECMASSISSGGFHDITKREGFCNPHPSICLRNAHSDPCLQGSPGFSNIVLNSQYLKAAQELLDEIVSVRKALRQPAMEKQEKPRDIGLDSSKDADGKSTSQSMQISSGPSNGSNSNPSCELSPVERQNLLDKKTKLLSMLDEVNL